MHEESRNERRSQKVKLDGSVDRLGSARGAARLKLGRPEKSMLIDGLRGVGKTVFLNMFEAIAEEAGFRTSNSKVMAHLGSGSYRSGEIAATLGRPGPKRVAPILARLIEKGLIYSPSCGLNEFTVPQFDAYIRRSFPLEQS